MYGLVAYSFSFQMTDDIYIMIYYTEKPPNLVTTTFLVLIFYFSLYIYIYIYTQNRVNLLTIHRSVLDTMQTYEHSTIHRERSLLPRLC